MLTLALCKGRLLGPSVQALRGAGICVPAELESDESRSLVYQAPEDQWRFIVARTGDVPTYVEHGTADLGVVGKDVLLEKRPDVYEVLDLGFGPGRFVVAAPRAAVPRVLIGAGPA